MTNFIEILKNNSYEIDTFLEKHLPIGNGLNKKLFEAMRYSSLHGGKKIRAFLVLESARFLSVINNKNISKSKYQELIAVASVIEAIHSYSLIHDDLPAMDNSPKRRGKPSSHIKFNHYTAILAGDALLSWAFQIIGDRTFIKSAQKRSDICFSLAKSVGVAAIILNVNKYQTNIITNYACNIGLAFQIADDLLDVDGNEAIVGKPIKQDTNNVTPNFVTKLGKDKAFEKALIVSKKAISLIQEYKYGTENLVFLAKYAVNRNY